MMTTRVQFIKYSKTQSFSTDLWIVLFQIQMFINLAFQLKCFTPLNDFFLKEDLGKCCLSMTHTCFLSTEGSK